MNYHEEQLVDTTKRKNTSCPLKTIERTEEEYKRKILKMIKEITDTIVKLKGNMNKNNLDLK